MYAIEYQGITVRCDSYEEFVRAMDYLRTQGTIPQQPGVATRQISSSKRYIIVLEALSQAGQKGIASEVLSRQLGFRGARGLGGMMGGFRRLLEERGFVVNDVVTIQGGRWVPGPRAKEAFEALRQSEDDDIPF